MTSLFAAMLATATVGALPAPDGQCDVSVAFGSYAMGVDQRAYERVEAWVDSHPGLVSGYTTSAWGREGERTLCLTTDSRRATARVFSQLRGLVRGRATRGPTEIATRYGQTWRSSPPIPR